MNLEKQTYGLGIVNRMREFDSVKFSEQGQCSVIINGKVSEDQITISENGEYLIQIIQKEKSSLQNISINVKEGVCATIIQNIAVESYGLSLTQNIVIASNATVTFTKQIEGKETFIFCQTNVEAKENSRVEIHEKIHEGKFVRNHVLTTLHENATLNHTTIFHTTYEHDIKSAVKQNGRKSSATLTTRGVVEDNAKGLFLGQVYIGKDAGKSQGHQKADLLLLGESAVGEAVPILEVQNDDVICSHGATISRIDEQMLFYVMSRGVGRDEAKKLIVQGFLGEGE